MSKSLSSTENIKETNFFQQWVSSGLLALLIACFDSISIIPLIVVLTDAGTDTSMPSAVSPLTK
jgi:hypothetical protein